MPLDWIECIHLDLHLLLTMLKTQQGEHSQHHQHQRAHAALKQQREWRRDMGRLQRQTKLEPALLQQIWFGPVLTQRHRSS